MDRGGSTNLEKRSSSNDMGLHPSMPRIPASSLLICGRPWLLGAEDLCVPAFCSLLFDFLMLSITAAANGLSSTTSLPPTCSSALQSQLTTALVFNVSIWLVITACDITILVRLILQELREIFL